MKIITGPLGKVKQINRTITAAKGDIYFMVHADMRFALDTLTSIEKSVYEEDVDAGGFANKFDMYNSKIKIVGKLLNFRFYENPEQSDKGFFYGDNGVFIRKKVVEYIGESTGSRRDIPLRLLFQQGAILKMAT